MATHAHERFTVSGASPRCLDAEVRRTIPERLAAAGRELAACSACPRGCAVDRSAGEEGYCGIGRCARVASSGPHFGEEDCLRGSRGSGTIFFAGCNLHCVFCQNWDISQRHTGRKVDAEGIAELMLDLQRAGCHNINLVTPEHVVPHVVEALAAAIESGVRLPVVYNTSAYDAIASLKLLDGLIDIYMPDFKFWSSQSSLEYVDAEDYADRARDAIREMHRQVGDLVFTPDGVACRGVLVRHLVMPGMLAETAAIFRWLADEVSPDTHVNIMAQYHPDNEVGRDEHEAIDRRPTAAEMKAAYGAATDAGLWRFDERWA